MLGDRTLLFERIGQNGRAGGGGSGTAGQLDRRIVGVALRLGEREGNAVALDLCSKQVDARGRAGVHAVFLVLHGAIHRRELGFPNARNGACSGGSPVCVGNAGCELLEREGVFGLRPAQTALGIGNALAALAVELKSLAQIAVVLCVVFKRKVVGPGAQILRLEIQARVGAYARAGDLRALHLDAVRAAARLGRLLEACKNGIVQG